MSTRIERLKEYAKPTSGPAGASTEKNIDYWSNRASENSRCAPRAKGGEMKLPSTGEMSIHDTSARPSRKGDARKQAKADLNFVGSSQYMRNVRRSES